MAPKSQTRILVIDDAPRRRRQEAGAGGETR